jgi:hypothetical protein
VARVLPALAAPAAVTRGPLRHRRVLAGLILACYLLAAVAMTWRLWADPASRTIAGNANDADLFAWFLRYDATAVAHLRLPALVTAAMNAPQGVNVMWNTFLLLPGVLLAPVTLTLGPQTTLTLLTTVGFAGSAASLFYVLRRWEVSLGAAALAGAVYGFSPALLHASVGHYNLQLAILPPLIIDALLRLCLPRGPGRKSADADASRDGRPKVGPSGWHLGGPGGRPPGLATVRTGLWLGLLITAQLFTAEELLLLTGIAGVLLVAVLAAGQPRAAVSRLGPVAAGLGVAAGVTLLLCGYALWVQFFGSLTQSGSAFLPDFFKNDITSFVTPSRYLLFHTAGSAAAATRYQGGTPEYLAYLGWPLIVALAAITVAFWRRPAVRATAVTLVVLELLSLGGHPLADGTLHTGVTLPWHWLEAVPVVGSALPDRFSIVADGMAAALLAYGLDMARARASSIRYGGVLVTAGAVLVCLPLIPRPLPAAAAEPLPAGWSAAFAALHLSPDARVLVVPVPTATLTAAMRWQADTGEPGSLIGGYFTGPAWNGRAYVEGNGVAATAQYLDGLWSGGRPAAAPSPVELKTDLDTWQPAAVVAVTSPGSALGRYLARLFGRPPIHAGGVLAWRL